MAAGLASASASASTSQGIWSACTIDTVSLCTATGCAVRKPAISIYLTNYMDRGAERAAYYRCAIGLTNCDRHTATVNRTGDFVIFSLPARSVFSKLGPDRRLVDVAAIGENVLVSRGRCTDAAPPSQLRLKSR